MKSIKWEITRRCNLQCKHCFVGKVEYEPDLELEEAKKIVDIVISSGARELQLTSKEPFAYKYINELLDYCAEKDIFLTIVTNGTMITEETIKHLAACKIKTISISLEGISAKSNDYIRGVGVFDRVMKSLELLHVLSNGSKYVVPIALQISLTAMNLEEIPDMIKWFSEKPFFAVNVGDISLVGNARDNMNIKLTEEQYDKAAKKLLDDYSKLHNPSFILTLKKATVFDTLYHNMCYGLAMEAYTPSCSAYHGYSAVLPNADICSCVALKDSHYEGVEGLSSTLNLLRDGHFENISRISGLGDYKKQGMCSKCRFKDDCEMCLLLIYDKAYFAEVLNKCKKAMEKLDYIMTHILMGNVYFKLNPHVNIWEEKGNVYLKKLSNMGSEHILDITEYKEQFLQLYDEKKFVTTKNMKHKVKDYEQLIDDLIYNDMLEIQEC